MIPYLSTSLPLSLSPPFFPLPSPFLPCPLSLAITHWVGSLSSLPSLSSLSFSSSSPSPLPLSPFPSSLPPFFTPRVCIMALPSRLLDGFPALRPPPCGLRSFRWLSLPPSPLSLPPPFLFSPPLSRFIGSPIRDPSPCPPPPALPFQFAFTAFCYPQPRSGSLRMSPCR